MVVAKVKYDFTKALDLDLHFLGRIPLKNKKDYIM